MQTEELNMPLQKLQGIGPARAAAFAKLGLKTVGDLLLHFPRAYQNRGKILSLGETEDGTVGAFLLTISSPPVMAQLPGSRILVRCAAFDSTGQCLLTFFNQPFRKDQLRTGMTFRFWGKLSVFGGRRELRAPQVEVKTEGVPLRDFLPLYGLTAGLSQKQVSDAVAQALRLASHLPTASRPEILPPALRRQYDLPDWLEALRRIHAPQHAEEIESARRRFMFEEMYLYSLAMTWHRRQSAAEPAPAIARSDLSPFLHTLPYALTGAQRRVIEEIAGDMAAGGSRGPMRRLLMGDVGSGKTVCAAAAVYLCVRAGYQAAVMAPTAILAAQHAKEFSALLGGLGISCELLTGGMRATEKRQLLNRLETGELNCVIGTHALLEDCVRFARPGLIVTDEQHRFGMMQRTALAEKQGSRDEAALTAHMLVMSATPIPRTLALMLYGDLDRSMLDEFPPGRQKVDTFVVGERYRIRLYGFIRKTVKEGHQVYIVCPAVEERQEESPAMGETAQKLPSLLGRGDEFFPDGSSSGKREEALRSAVKMAERLQNEVFPDLTTACLHGKMKSAEKDRIMASFAAGEISILVSTTVIEVGMNVPNAVLMVVENAERFGLSTLHQLRGRVGRGKDKSWCILVSDSRSEKARARLRTMCETNDGAWIARCDLEQRGPGDFLPMRTGQTRQHGGMTFRLAGQCCDPELPALAAEAAALTLTQDPSLAQNENRAAAKLLETLFSENVNTFH